MKQILPVLSRALFYIVAGVLLFWTASLTMRFIGNALPQIAMAKYLGLVIFDVGAVSWLLIFLKASEGLGQRAVSLGLSLVDLAGVALLVFAEIFTGGQSIVDVPGELGNIALWAIGIWTCINLFGVFAYHLADVEAQREIASRNAQDKVTARALTLLEKRMDAIADGVADSLAADWEAQAVFELGSRSRRKLSAPARAFAVDAGANVDEHFLPGERQE